MVEFASMFKENEFLRLDSFGLYLKNMTSAKRQYST